MKDDFLRTNNLNVYLYGKDYWLQWLLCNVISSNLSWHKWNLVVHWWFVCNMSLLFDRTIVYCCKFWSISLISAC